MSKFLDSIKKYSLFINLIFLVIIIILIYVCYSLSAEYKKASQLVKELSKPTPTPVAETPEAMEAGEVGEVLVKDEKTGEDKPLIDVFTPAVIFDTLGDILEVRENYLVVKGSGANFADRTPRDLKVIFTEYTVTFTKNQLSQYKGKEGLLHLKPGMKIAIEATENIRGKTEFPANTINIIN